MPASQPQDRRAQCANGDCKHPRSFHGGDRGHRCMALGCSCPGFEGTEVPAA